jgi:hypothetical protein
LPRPNLTFFCELETPELLKLFSDKKVLVNLSALEANVSLGLLDLSDERAEIVKKLTKAGIPVTAWLLLSKNEGYWTNLDTVKETTRQYALFKAWTIKHKLQWAAVGLDIEPKLNYLLALQNNLPDQIPTLITRFFSPSIYAKLEYDARILVQIIRSDGFPVESYQFPTVVEERAARSNVLSKILGIAPLNTDREVLMLYSSFFPSRGESILWSYARNCKAVGIGSTGGGVELDGMPALKILRWIDLKRDLLLANQLVKNIYVFSLEGCAKQGYLNRILLLDWETPIQPPIAGARKISILRNCLIGILWIFSHPIEILLSIITVVFAYRHTVHRNK